MTSAIDGMRRAAADLIDVLDDDQRARACLPFEDEVARHDWHYIPRARAGISFRRMNATQQHRAYRLLASGLSLHAFAQATTIIALEDVLDVIESNDLGRNRHRADYSTSIFGDPDGREPWAWRFEGHHVSINVTVVDPETVAPTPLFLGANPAEVRGPDGASVIRPLAAEEDLARALLVAMDKSQRAAAIVSRDAPNDILTTAEPLLDRSAMPAPEGVAISELSGKPRDLFEALLETYVGRLPLGLVEARREALHDARSSLVFAWAGGTKRHDRHYYRIQGDGVLIEYDNTQNDANHIHTVWRDPDGDFGANLLRQHYERHHTL